MSSLRLLTNYYFVDKIEWQRENVKVYEKKLESKEFAFLFFSIIYILIKI